MKLNKNIFQRLFLFVVGVPLILVLPIYLHHFNFLALFVVCSVAIFIATYEVHSILTKKYSAYPLVFFMLIALINFTSLYFFSYNKISPVVFLQTFVLPIFCLTVTEIIVSQKDGFEKSLERILSGFFIFLYPIWFGDFFLMLTQLKAPRTSITMFFVIVFACDSLAWFFGMLFGDGNRGIFKASPKKSVAGLFGVLVSIAVCTAVAYYFVPHFKTLWSTAVIMCVTHIAAVIGDLFESILKRSADIKDSGKIVMGRGGILDSIDSMLFAAPVYYFLSKVLL